MSCRHLNLIPGDLQLRVKIFGYLTFWNFFINLQCNSVCCLCYPWRKFFFLILGTGNFCHDGFCRHLELGFCVILEVCHTNWYFLDIFFNDSRFPLKLSYLTLNIEIFLIVTATGRFERVHHALYARYCALKAISLNHIIRCIAHQPVSNFYPRQPSRHNLTRSIRNPWYLVIDRWCDCCQISSWFPVNQKISFYHICIVPSGIIGI